MADLPMPRGSCLINSLYYVSNSMLVFSRIPLRVSSLWAFLFWRHIAFLSFTEVFRRNSIYKKATSFISFMAKSSRFSGCVCHISCFLVNFEGSLQALSLVYNMPSAPSFCLLWLVIYHMSGNNATLKIDFADPRKRSFVRSFLYTGSEMIHLPWIF